MLVFASFHTLTKYLLCTPCYCERLLKYSINLHQYLHISLYPEQRDIHSSPLITLWSTALWWLQYKMRINKTELCPIFATWRFSFPECHHCHLWIVAFQSCSLLFMFQGLSILYSCVWIQYYYKMDTVGRSIELPHPRGREPAKTAKYYYPMFKSMCPTRLETGTFYQSIHNAILSELAQILLVPPKLWHIVCWTQTVNNESLHVFFRAHRFENIQKSCLLVFQSYWIFGWLDLIIQGFLWGDTT